MSMAEGAPASVEVSELLVWLLSPHVPRTPEALIGELGPRLVTQGVRVARIAAIVRALDPNIMGQRFVWRRGDPQLDVLNAPYEILQTREHLESPTGYVISTGREGRWRLGAGDDLPYDVLVQQRQAGMTDYFAAPLHFLGGAIHTVTYATDAPGGFSDAELDAFRQVAPPLSRVAEIVSLRRTAATLLDAYVGHHAGARILSGRIRRGETEIIDCVIWFSDLRGFTTLSGRQPPRKTVDILNRLFDCQVPAVERHGGEVLKFMGDGMLAIFPVVDTSALRAATQSAVRAAEGAFTELDAWNRERASSGEGPLSFGLAIHVGQVGYGNIGGARRLDFTCIGAAVNLASRVEGLTGKLGKRVLLTEAAAQALSGPTRLVGAYEVKGVSPAPSVYELDLAWAAQPPNA
jgi:adenylate cyclase